MRYKEFKKAIEEWGEKYNYKPVVEVVCNYIYIDIMFEGNGYPDTICAIHKSERLVIDLDWIPYKNLSENEKKELFKIVTEFAATKPEDREDEKYKFRHKYLGGQNSNYLKYDTVGGNWILGHDIKTYDFKGEFTIDELKEKFNSDLDDWEIIEVEDNEFEYTCQQDLSDWIVDNWFTVADCIGFALQTMIVDSKKDIVNIISDRDETVEFISERVKEGILNVIGTYEVEE